MITGINHITLSVCDIEVSFVFYKDVLGFTPIQKSRNSAYLVAGETWISLIRDAHVRREPRQEYTHIAFNVRPEDFDKVISRLQAAGVQKWKENISEGDSFYFLDPNGHKLEIAVSNLQNRIEHGKQNWGDGIEWFV